MQQNLVRRLRGPARRRRLVATASGLALAAASLSVLTMPDAQAADPVTINLVGINDFHGRINANTVKWAGTVEQVKARADAANTVFVGAGDLVGASEFASAIQNDQPTIDVLNELGLDASSVGNHEFDKGWSDLKDRIIGPDSSRNAAWDYLGANVYAKGTTTPVLPEYWETEVSGITVAVIGAVTEETSSLVSPGGISTIDFGPIVPALNRVAGELTDGDQSNGEADVVVATVHAGAIKGAGSTYEEQVAQDGEFQDMALHLSPEIDAVFQGHTHQVYAWDAPVTGGDLATRPLLQTGSYGDNVGNIQLFVDPDTKKVVSYTKENVARVTTADADLIAAYPVLSQVKTTVDAALANAATVGNQPVGSITGDITTALPDPTAPVTVTGSGNRDDRGSESTLGDLVGNALRDGVPADIGKPDLGIVNPGGLRAELLYAGDTTLNPANTDGVVTYAEANNVLPFVNNIWLVDVSGATLKRVLEQQWQPTGASRPFLALGLSDNVQVAYDPDAAAGSHIRSVYVDGAPIDPTAIYTVSTFSFLGTGGDNFTAFTQGTSRDTGLVDRDLWISYLQDNPGIAPDFARQQVGVSGGLVAGTTSQVGLSKLDLTSSGRPLNTAVTVTGRDADGYETDLGTYAVTGGSMKRLIAIPAELAGGTLTFDAAPSGTTTTVAVRSRTTLSAKAATVGPGSKGTVRVTARADGVTPTGAVLIRRGSTTLGTAVLEDGSGTATLDTAALAPGSYVLTAAYAGDGVSTAASQTFTLKVNKAAARIAVTLPAKKIVKNRTRAVVRIGVTGFQGRAASGRVTVRAAGKAVVGTLRNGVVTVRLPKFRSVGRKVVTLTYAGDSATTGATVKVTLRVKKK